MKRPGTHITHMGEICIVITRRDEIRGIAAVYFCKEYVH